MEILCIQPEQRLIRTEFDQVRDSKEERRTFFIYTCPVCRQKASFALDDLIRNCQPSPLSGAGSVPILYRALFDWESRSKKGSEKTPEKPEKPEQTPEKPDEINGIDGIFYQDFQCSGCDQPVRIEYTARLNSTDKSSLKIVRILEIILPPFPKKEELLAGLNRVTDLFYSLSSGQPPAAFPSLWLVALILLPILHGYDNSQDMAGIFFQERQKFDAIIGWSFVWEWIDEGHEFLMRDQFSLWLAMILRFGEAVEAALARMLKIADLLQQQNMEKGPQTLSMALALALENNCSNEEILARADRMIRLRKAFPTQEKSGLFLEPVLMLVLTDDSYPDYLRQIRQALEERNFLLTPGDKRSASLLLSLQGMYPKVCVDRFMNLGEVFNLAMTQREESLVDPAFFPDEGHPFQKVVLSLINEFSPLFPFDSSCCAPIALLSALPWKAEDLARESIGLYHYLRSYRTFIRPDTSFWVSTGLVFSAWEGGTCPYLFLFWFLASLELMVGIQPQEETSRTISIHRV